MLFYQRVPVFRRLPLVNIAREAGLTSKNEQPGNKRGKGRVKYFKRFRAIFSI
jgi:hypothetical protein